MSKKLGEGEVGCDLNQIEHVEVNTCIGITAIKGKSLIGAHFSMPITGMQSQYPSPDKLWQKLRLENRVIPYGRVTAVYAIGALEMWRAGNNCPYEWPFSFYRDVAAVWGGGVTVRSWDTTDTGTVTIRVVRTAEDVASLSYGVHDAGQVGAFQPIGAADLISASLEGWG